MKKGRNVNRLLALLLAVCLTLGLTYTAFAATSDPIGQDGNALGTTHEHEWEWVVDFPATCTEEGLESHTCLDCSYEETVPIEKLPHDFKWEIIEEATDHSAGIRTNVCQVCGYKEEQVSYDPEGTLRRGDRSEEVREMQQLLADQNYLNADGADGIFGGGTEAALMKFQDDQNLTPDGVAWPQTIRRLHHDFSLCRS